MLVSVEGEALTWHSTHMDARGKFQEFIFFVFQGVWVSTSSHKAWWKIHLFAELF